VIPKGSTKYFTSGHQPDIAGSVDDDRVALTTAYLEAESTPGFRELRKVISIGVSNPRVAQTIDGDALGSVDSAARKSICPRQEGARSESFATEPPATHALPEPSMAIPPASKMLVAVVYPFVPERTEPELDSSKTLESLVIHAFPEPSMAMGALRLTPVYPFAPKSYGAGAGEFGHAIVTVYDPNTAQPVNRQCSRSAQATPV